MSIEKKLPDDNLEEFLRNSFNQYNETPSDRVWDRIDNSLSSAPLTKTPNYKKIVYPIAATVVLCTLTFLVYTNYKLKNELKAALSQQNIITESDINTRPALKANIENNKIVDSSNTIPMQMEEKKSNLKIETENKDLDTNVNTDHLSNFNNSGNTQNIIVPKSNKQKKITSDNSDKIAIHNLTEIKNTNPIHSEKTREGNVKNKKIKQNQISQTKNTSNPDLVSNDFKPENTEIGIDISQINESMSESLPIGQESKVNINKKYYVASLPVNNDELQIKENETRFVTFYPVQIKALPIRGLNATEIAVLAGNYFESGTIKNELYQGNQGGKRTNEFKTNDARQVGLTLNKSISENLFLTSGIGYKNLKIVNNIKEIIPFGNRRPKPGGMPFQHDFRFKIKCNAGSSDIVINTEQLDSRASYTDNQPIVLNVRTEFELSYLSIPIGLQYRYSKNRFFAGLGLGLNIDILTRSTVPDFEIQILNNILKPIQKPQVDRLSQTKDFVLNTKANLVLGYSLNKNFKFILSPELNIPISNRTQDRDGTIETNAWGIQAGISYNLY